MSPRTRFKRAILREDRRGPLRETWNQSLGGWEVRWVNQWTNRDPKKTEPNGA